MLVVILINRLRCARSNTVDKEHKLGWCAMVKNTLPHSTIWQCDQAVFGPSFGRWTCVCSHRCTEGLES